MKVLYQDRTWKDSEEDPINEKNDAKLFNANAPSRPVHIVAEEQETVYAYLAAFHNESFKDLKTSVHPKVEYTVILPKKGNVIKSTLYVGDLPEVKLAMSIPNGKSHEVLEIIREVGKSLNYQTNWYTTKSKEKGICLQYSQPKRALRLQLNK